MNKVLPYEKSEGFVRCFLKYNKNSNNWSIHHYHFYNDINDIVYNDGTDYESITFPIHGCEEYFGQKNIECPIKDISIENVPGNPIAIYVIMCTDEEYDYDYINSDNSGLCPIAVYKCEKTETLTIVNTDKM